MSEEKNDKNLEMTGHNYDGITELDNPMPSWWIWTFLFTIIFSFLYYIHYEVGGGPTLKQELASAMQELEQNKSKEPALMETEEMLATAMSNPSILAAGSEVFTSKCVVCHGVNLQGQVGPNLTDKYWIHGKGTRMDIVKVIREGVLDKGMPTFDQILSRDEVYAAAAFVLSKRGSNPPNPKAPQGNAIE